jgi:3-dehydroquinate dehydratase type I
MICVSLAKTSFKKLQQTLQKVAMAEIRLDEMTLSKKEIVHVFAMPLPLIATCRPGRYSEIERLEMLSAAIVSGAAYIDIEMDANGAYHHALQKLAKDHHCRLIISYHNENETPSKKQLNKIVTKCFSQGAAIVKVACQVCRREDVLRIIALYEYALAKEGSLIALGMGAQGKLTRVAASLLGAPFTYAALAPGRETASGQMSVARMAKMIGELKGA